MKIPKQEDLAILFMSELTRSYGQRVVPLSEVAHTHGVSMLFLKKLARLLRQEGLVQSKEGVTGGYSLRKTPQHITVWDIIQAVTSSPSSPVPQQIKNRDHCPLFSDCLPQTIRKRLEDTLAKSFQTITLNDLIR